MLSVLRGKPGGTALADPTHGKLDGGGFQTTRMLRTYGDVVNFLLRTPAADEVIAEAYNDAVKLRRSRAITEKTYS